jgi:hypothetical protein
LVLEMACYALTLAAQAEGAHEPAAVREWMAAHVGRERLATLQRMFAALRDITQPNGLIPLVGDTDAGRFLYLEAPNDGGRDWRFLSCVGAALFDDPTLLAPAVRTEDWTAARLLLGAEPGETEAAAGPVASGSASYPDAGLYIMRGAGFHSLISCGPIGTDGKGGHAHNDKLALTLCLDGQEILVDPGIYVYTASKAYRDAYRSVLAHNTVAIAGEEQNRFLEDSPWWGCHEDTHCKCLAWEGSPGKDIFVGEHQAYARLQPPLRHRRRIEWHKQESRVVITDRLLTDHAEGDLPQIHWTFMFHPECRLVGLEGHSATIQRQGLHVRLVASRGQWQERRAWYSPTYGIKQDCLLLTIDVAPGVTRNVISITWQATLG